MNYGIVVRGGEKGKGPRPSKREKAMRIEPKSKEKAKKIITSKVSSCITIKHTHVHLRKSTHYGKKYKN